MRSFGLLLSVFCLLGCQNPNLNDDNCEKKDILKKFEQFVLDENKVGTEFLLKEKVPNEIFEYSITYLGTIDNKKEGRISFLHTISFSGLYEDAKRANTSIVIYKGKKLLGTYYVGYLDSIQLKDYQLTLVNRFGACNQKTVIDFKDSIPNLIFINCREDHNNVLGDLYKFYR